MDSVQKTDLTSDTSVGRTEADTVDVGDFFEIAKPAEDFKISATNLILGLLKFAPVYLQGVPSFGTGLNKAVNAATQTLTITLDEIKAKQTKLTFDITQAEQNMKFIIDLGSGNYEDVYLYIFIEINSIIVAESTSNLAISVISDVNPSEVAIWTSINEPHTYNLTNWLNGWYLVNKAANRIAKQ